MNQAERNRAPSKGGLPVGGFAALVPELDVTNLQDSLTFWCDLLGFDVAYDRVEAGFAYLQLGRLQIMLCEVSGEWLTGNLEHPFGRGVNFQMKVEALAPIVQRLNEADWKLFRQVERKRYAVGMEWAECDEFLVQDPDGYLIRFAADL